jgi:uncharacterized protein with NRDE domain
MCIAAFDWNPDSTTPLLLAANRDEFFARPTAPMHWWPGDRVLAGRDLKANGAWLGVTRSGRIALLTNIRNPALRREGAPSRGDIVKKFLESAASPAAFAVELAADAARYEGFNVVCGQVSGAARELWFLNSAEAAPKRLNTGIYGLSNASLNSEWPKLTRIKQGLRHALAEPELDAQNERLLRLLHNTTRANDSQLPSTGVPLEWERALSAIFIRHGDYGTRASTVLRISGGRADLSEVNYAADATTKISDHRDFSFEIELVTA